MNEKELLEKTAQLERRIQTLEICVRESYSHRSPQSLDPLPDPDPRSGRYPTSDGDER